MVLDLLHIRELARQYLGASRVEGGDRLSVVHEDGGQWAVGGVHGCLLGHVARRVSV